MLAAAKRSRVRSKQGFLYRRTRRAMLGHLRASVVSIEAVGAVVELVAQAIVVGLVFAAILAAIDVQITVDTRLHLVAHLFAVDGFADLRAAAGGERQGERGEQEQGHVTQGRTHDDSLSWCARRASLVCV